MATGKVTKAFNFLYVYSTDRIILKRLGFYPFSNDKWLLYYTLRTITFSFYFIYFTSTVAYIIENINLLLKVLQTFYLIFTAIGVLVKLTVFITYSDVFTLLESYFRNEILYDTTSGMLIRMKTKVETTMKILKFYRLWVLLTLIAFLGTPLLAGVGNYRLLSAGIFPWEINNIYSYTFTIFMQAFCAICGALLSVTVDTTFAIFCAIVRTELQLLKDNLRKMNYCDTTMQIKSELKKNLMLYDQILRISSAIQELFSYTLFCNFIINIILICLSGFISTQFVIDENTELFEKIDYLFNLGYFGYLLFQVSVYCYYGHEVMTESSDVNEAIFLSNWYVADKSIQNDLIIFRERLKRPICLKAGNVFPLTFPTLVQILKASYSVFTLLQQMD